MLAMDVGLVDMTSHFNNLPVTALMGIEHNSLCHHALTCTIRTNSKHKKYIVYYPLDTFKRIN
jgi:hypothetical protein